MSLRGSNPDYSGRSASRVKKTKTEELSRKKVMRIGQQAEKRKDRNSKKGLSRRTREEIVKWNQMTALRFKTG